MLTKIAQRIAEEHGYDFVLQQDLLIRSFLTKCVKNKEKIDRSNLANARKQFKERSHTWYCSSCLYVYKSRYAIDDKSICKNCSSKGMTKIYQYDLENLVYPLYRFGVEFEGVWTRNPHYKKLIDKDNLFTLDQKSDGSVKGFGSVDNLYHIGEMTTEPIRFNTKGLELFRHIIKRAYPDKTNKFCGGHVHFSMSNNKMVEPLMTKDFYDGVFGGLEHHVEKNCTRTGQNEFFDRIEENSGYCKDVFDPENSIIRNSDRYFRMNLHPWYQRHTVEFRILPQFHDSSDYYTCVMYLLNYVDSYLRDHLWIGEGNQKTNIEVNDFTKRTKVINYKLLKPIIKLEEEMLVENVNEDFVESTTDLTSWQEEVKLQKLRSERSHIVAGVESMNVEESTYVDETNTSTAWNDWQEEHEEREDEREEDD